MFRILALVVAIFAVVVSTDVLAVGPVKAQKKMTAVKRSPSNTKANCSDHGCACDDLNRQTAVCASVVNPPNSAPRNSKAMRDCYLNLVQKRREASVAKASCPAIDRSSMQVEDLRELLVQADASHVQVSSSKGLEGFGMDLVGHLGGQPRTPASGN